jgi:hypothetical protein
MKTEAQILESRREEITFLYLVGGEVVDRYLMVNFQA